MPARTEQVPAARTAMSDLDGAAVEADADGHARTRSAIAPDQRLREIRTITGHSAGEWNARSECRDEPIDKFVAVHVQPVGEHEYAGQILAVQSPPDRFAATARLSRLGDVLADQPQPRRAEADRRRHDFIITDVAVVDLSAGAAADDMRGWNISRSSR